MPLTVTRTAFVFVTIAVFLLTNVSCTSKPKTLVVDLDPYVQSASQRFDANVPAMTSSARLEVTGTRAMETELGVHSCYIDKGIDTGTSLGSMFGDSNAGKRMLTTPQPLGTYVQSAMSKALASQGIDAQSEGVASIVVELTRVEYPFKDSQLQQAIIEASASVMADGNSIYTKAFAVEAEREMGNTSQALDAGGLLLGAFSPVTFSGEGQRQTEYKEVFRSCWIDAFSKLQDQIMEDPDLIAAIKTGKNPLVP